MATQLKPKLGSGTTEGTDQASAERNLRQDYENLKLDEALKKEYEPRSSRGTTEKITPEPLPSAPAKFNPKDFMEKPVYKYGKDDLKDLIKPVKKAKGGAVKSASARADGCAQRGKTRGKFV